ncbi:PREDICTED: cholecystokinin receptor type A-like [Bactrocera latifrons]|uniref:cholecystokinin receptor type A-like n=1 Tax=Bactrocera latifrons TaxID=174628 RepID=UPI0008DE1499|nr:PREDICTED: cholecystokinin receptor type A-like [Bactrocera latifrons]
MVPLSERLSLMNSPKEYESEKFSNYSYELKSKSTSPTPTYAAAISVTSVETAAAGTLNRELLNEDLNMTDNENVSLILPQAPSPLTFVLQNESTFGDNGTYAVTPRISSEIPIWLIPCYCVIFFFAIFGNLLVISTLVQNRRMRNVTNVFLLNLAISDMLLGVLCMPVTLVGTLLRHFIFGEFFCKLIQFSQAASVAVSSWTLVAISCERYYAICHPLRSRTWQTINHAYRIIGFIWFGSMICMTPIALFSQLIPTSRQGLRKCRDQWPVDTIAYERFYNIFLDLTLLVLPLFVLCVAYILITRTLYVGMCAERALVFGGNSIIGSTPAEQHDDSSLGAIATVTKSTAAAPSATMQSPFLRRFNSKMSLRCHSRQANIGNYGIRSDGQDVAAGTQSDTSYHQQHQQHPQQKQSQLKYCGKYHTLCESPHSYQ